MSFRRLFLYEENRKISDQSVTATKHLFEDFSNIEINTRLFFLLLLQLDAPLAFVKDTNLIDIEKSQVVLIAIYEYSDLFLHLALL